MSKGDGRVGRERMRESLRVPRVFVTAVFCFSLMTHDPRLIPVFAAETVEEVDTDKDGKPDEWKYYQANQLDRVERDRDHNGIREIKIWMKEGKPERSEVDRNGDGTPDLVRFLQEGKPVREHADLNFDGKLDAWSYYREGGVKDFMILDKNHDGRPDAWFYYGQGGLRVAGGKVDEDFDGKTDRTFGAFPKEEKRGPW